METWRGTIPIKANGQTFDDWFPIITVRFWNTPRGVTHVMNVSFVHVMFVQSFCNNYKIIKLKNNPLSSFSYLLS
jgi:hypothetical protein